MADFSSSEKINASWKHLFGIVGTNNGDGAAGKAWYEELLAGSHIIRPSDIWADPIPAASSQTAARTIATTNPEVVQDRSRSETITLVPNGSNWDIVATVLPPVVGMQITNTHPSPTYIKSITAVIDNGGGSYTITLNSNTGVSAGAARLQGRIFLTVDPTSNGKAWFAKSIYGDHFSAPITNFIQPQLYGAGYAVRLYQANGTEVVTTEGAWIFNWQKGLMLFGNGYTPANLGYAQPMYIDAFRYVGAIGAGTALPDGQIHDTIRFDGTNWVPTSALKCDDVNVGVLNDLTISGALITSSGVTPSGALAPGVEGEIRWDSNYMYLKTGGVWKRSSFQNF